MIINTEYNNGKLIVSYINKSGNLEFKNYTWNNILEWKLTQENDHNKSDKFKTWDNKPVKLEMVRWPNKYTIMEYLHKKISNEDKEEIFAYNEPKITFCDIEVEITEGFPQAHIAENKVTALCLIQKHKVLLLGIKDLTSAEVQKMNDDMNVYFKDYNKNYKLEFIYCRTETELLSLFFNELIKTMPVITGWNFVKYDWVYLVTRARKLGINPNVASPTSKLIRPWNKNSEVISFEELPKHRLVFDYMDIFAKWDTSIKIKESNSLDFVSSDVLGVKKLQFEDDADGKSMNLKDAYHKDYYHYMLYNCIDTALVQLIHERQRTFDLMLAISNLAAIPIEDSVSAIRVTEGIFFNDYYDAGIIFTKNKQSYLDTSDEDVSEKGEYDAVDDDLAGGYVKYPTTGLKRWVTVFDFSSLYPTTMRQFNIAPESYKGIKINENESLLNGVRYDIEDDDIVLLNGTVFKNEESNTKKILTRIFTDRKMHKNIAMDYKKQKQLLKDYLETRK